MNPSLADSLPLLTGAAGQRGCCCAGGSAVSKATPQRNKSSLRIFSILRLREGSSKRFLFFEELNSPCFIFLRIWDFQPPPSCFSWRTPGTAGEALPHGRRGRGDAGCREHQHAAPLQGRLCSPANLRFACPPIRCPDGLSEILMDAILHQAAGAEDRRPG